MEGFALAEEWRMQILQVCTSAGSRDLLPLSALAMLLSPDADRKREHGELNSFFLSDAHWPCAQVLVCVQPMEKPRLKWKTLSFAVAANNSLAENIHFKHRATLHMLANVKLSPKIKQKCKSFTLIADFSCEAAPTPP